MSLHPTAGVRILLERGGHPSGDPGGSGGAGEPPGPVRYRGAVLTPEARFDYDVLFGPDGAPAISPAPGAEAPPPARALELLTAIARTVGRHALSESPPSWPRRVLRWRKAA